MKFENDCVKCFFFAQNVAQRKQKFAISFAKIANGNPTLISPSGLNILIFPLSCQIRIYKSQGYLKGL